MVRAPLYLTHPNDILAVLILSGDGGNGDGLAQTCISLLAICILG